jgi:hypothetical protein
VREGWFDGTPSSPLLNNITLPKSFTITVTITITITVTVPITITINNPPGAQIETYPPVLAVSALPQGGGSAHQIFP